MFAPPRYTRALEIYSQAGAQMVRVSVMYPNGAGNTFDMAYYCGKHIPMAQRLLGAALKAVSVEEGIAGGEIGSPAPFLAIGHLTFDSLDAFMAAFLPVFGDLRDDIPNYTNTKPTIQISDVKLSS
jgi:uncharacterized protein (TIGR02118 family)